MGILGQAGPRGPAGIRLTMRRWLAFVPKGDEGREAVSIHAVIDSCVFHEWASTSVLAPYMPANWAHILDQPMTSVKTQRPYFNPLGVTAQSASTDGAVIPVLESPATSLDRLRERILVDTPRERVVLSYDDGLMSTTFPAHYVARTVVQAANDWTAEEWLAGDERLYGLIMISTMLPADAAAEIRRSGVNERMVGIAMGGNGLSRPFGHPVYHPIYEAAVELGLPLVLQMGRRRTPARSRHSSPAAPRPHSVSGAHQLAIEPGAHVEHGHERGVRPLSNVKGPADRGRRALGTRTALALGRLAPHQHPRRLPPRLPE